MEAKLDSRAVHRESRPQTNRVAPGGALATSDPGAGQASSPAKARTAATDWVFLTHPTCPVGMELRYRIKDRIAEIAFTGAFKGDREALLTRATPPFVTDESGSHRFVRLPPLNTTADAEEVSDADAALVADALERLIQWWGSVSNA